MRIDVYARVIQYLVGLYLVGLHLVVLIAVNNHSGVRMLDVLT